MTSFTTHPALRRFWHPVLGSSDVAGMPRPVRLLSTELVVWRDGSGAVAAAHDVCPHRQAPLSAGRMVDGCLECPYHGWRFDGSGACTLVPSAGEGAAVPPRARLESVHAAERYGLLWICLDEPVSPIPDVGPFENDPSFRRINQPIERWHTATTRMVDNFLDYAHFPYVHVGTLGGATDPEVASVELQLLGDFYGYEYEVEVTNEGAATEASGLGGATVTRRMSTGFALPFLVRSTIEYPTGLKHMLLLCSTPIDDEWSLFTFVVWRNDDFSVPGHEVTAFDRAIGAEDHAMLTKIRGTLPLDQTTLVNVQADRASVEWRRRLRMLMSELQPGGR